MRIEIDHGRRTGTSDAVQGASIGMDGFMQRMEQMMKLQSEADAMRLARADGDRRAAAHAQDMERGRLDMEAGREDLRQSKESFPIKKQAMNQEIDLRAKRDAREADEESDRGQARQMSLDDASAQRESDDARKQRALGELRRFGATPAELRDAARMTPDDVAALAESRKLAKHAKHRAIDASDRVRDAYSRGIFGPPMEGPPEPGQPLGAAEQMAESILAELEANPYGAEQVMERVSGIEDESFQIAKKREQRAGVAESLMPLIQGIDNPKLFAEAMSTLRGYISGVHNDVSTVFSKIGDAVWLSQMDLTTLNEMSQGNPAIRNALIMERDAVEQGMSDARTAGRRMREIIQKQTILSPSEMEPETVSLPLGKKADGGGFEPVKTVLPASAKGRGRAFSSLRPRESADDHGAMMFWYDQASKVNEAAARDILGDKKAKVKDPETTKRLAQELMLRYGGWTR